MSKIRTGVSGWSHEGWGGDYFPADLAHRRRLAFLSERMDSVEANGTFYSLLSPAAYRRWYEETARGFLIAVKGSRFITHNKKLTDARGALANYFASGVLALREKVGPLLWQLSKRHRFRRERLEPFLAMLPRDTESAARLARDHDDRVDEPYLDVDANHRLRHVVEARHESFFTDEAVRVLRDAGVALAISHAGDWPMSEELTAGFVYIRLHGAPNTYSSGYDARALDEWARKIYAWSRGARPEGVRTITGRAPPKRKERDVYVYFDNDGAGRAPHDALALAERV